jgi:hypothetical protein
MVLILFTLAGLGIPMLIILAAGYRKPTPAPQPTPVWTIAALAREHFNGRIPSVAELIEFCKLGGMDKKAFLQMIETAWDSIGTQEGARP